MQFILFLFSADFYRLFIDLYYFVWYPPWLFIQFIHTNNCFSEIEAYAKRHNHDCYLRFKYSKVIHNREHIELVWKLSKIGSWHQKRNVHSCNSFVGNLRNQGKCNHKPKLLGELICYVHCCVVDEICTTLLFFVICWEIVCHYQHWIGTN